MSDKNYLTVDEFRKMRKREFLPSIRREVKLEIETLSVNIQVLTDQCSQIEHSIQFLSDKYDTVLGILQATKKQIAGLEVNVKNKPTRFLNSKKLITERIAPSTQCSCI